MQHNELHFHRSLCLTIVLNTFIELARGGTPPPRSEGRRMRCGFVLRDCPPSERGPALKGERGRVGASTPPSPHQRVLTSDCSADDRRPTPPEPPRKWPNGARPIISAAQSPTPTAPAGAARLQHCRRVFPRQGR